MRSQAANTPAGQLDVATIRTYLHTNLQQSAFTDVNEAHAANVLPATVPASPFKVNSGSSATFLINGRWVNLLTDLNFNLNQEIPLLAGVPVNAGGVNATLGRYLVDIYDSIDNPHGTLYLRPIVGHPFVSNDQALADSFTNNILNNAPHHIQVQANFVAAAPEQASIIRQLHRDQENFSGVITIRALEPGEILVRCCQQNSPEPGGWWVKIQDMPLSIADVRSGIAVLPEWNQNGNLEFFVVPEGSNIIILEGMASSQELQNTNNYRWLNAGQNVTILRNPGNMIIGLQFPEGHRNNPNLSTNWLDGGVTQVAIVGNWDSLNNRPGNAFQGYYQAIAIIETGFDVELL
jgi:hypothetical protein